MGHNVVDYQKARDRLKRGVQRTLNKYQAETLFFENAVLFGDRDGVPESVAKLLFGECAVEYAKAIDTKGKIKFNGYGIGDYTQRYLTFDGFMVACTFNNVSILESENTRNERAGRVTHGESEE